MTSKSIIYATLSLFSVALIATAQDAPAPQPAPEVAPPVPQREAGMRLPRQMMGVDSGAMFARMLSRPEFVKNLGLPEEVAEKVSTGLKEIDTKEKELMTKRAELLKAQTDMMAALMSDRTKNGDEARQATADLEALQVQISSLNIDRMLLIRDNLSDDQIKQAREQVKKDYQSRREEMMKRRGLNGQPGQEGQRVPNFNREGRGPRAEGDRGPRFGGERGPRPNGDKGPREGGDKAPAPAAEK